MLIRVITIICFFCLSQLVSGQVTINLGAIVEDEKLLWTLDTINLYKDSTVISWKVKSKVAKAKITSIDHILLKDGHTGILYEPTIITEKQLKFRKAFETKEFKTHYPAIYDTTFISIQISPTLHVDSIKIVPDDTYYLFYNCKYRASLLNHTPLNSRADSINYSDSLYNKGMFFYKTNRIPKAVICFEQCYAFDRLMDEEYENLGKRKRSNYSRKWLGHCYYIVGDVELAKSFYVNDSIEPYDRKRVEKTDSLYNLHIDEKNLDTIIDDYGKMCSLDSLEFGPNHYRYALSLQDLGLAYCSYSSNRDFRKAIEILLKAYSILNKTAPNSSLAKEILSDIAHVEYEIGDYISAIHSLEQSLEIANDDIVIDGDKETIFISSYNDLAYYYGKIGNWPKAIEITRKRIDYYKTLQDDLALQYVLGDYAFYLANAGYIKQALRLYKRLYNSTFRTRELEMGNICYDIGYYDNAIEYYRRGVDKYGNISVLNSIYSSMANCYAAMNRQEEAIKIQKDVITNDTDDCSFSASFWLNDYKSYITNISNLAFFYNLNEQYDSALVWEKKNLKLIDKYFSPNSDEAAHTYLNLGISYGGKGEWDEAIKYIRLSYTIFKRQKDKLYYNRSLYYLSELSFQKGDYANLIKYIQELFLSSSNDLIFTFQELTYDERAKYIVRYSKLMNNQIPMYAYYVLSDSLTSLAYDASLLINGALLNSENSVKRVINESNNDSLKELYEGLRANRYILSKEIEKDSLERMHNIDSLQNIIYNLEDSLVVKCKEYDDVTKSMKLKWQDIQKHLSPQDIAIEFLRIPIHNDSVMYAALTLQRDSPCPIMIPLFEERQLKQVSDSLYFQNKDMTDLVWKPLLSELRDVDNIYFSPSGVLYNIGIEYLPGMENYNLYRLSSTRELVTRTELDKDRHAVLYGGLDYYASFDSLASNQKTSITDELFIDHADVRGMKMRGGKELLPQTKIEVEQIGKELKNAQWNYALLTGDIGTEESFKSLSGKKVGTMHISTHGFYYTPEEADKMNYDFLRLDNRMASAEDRALTRSGLIMSGANHILEGEELPDNVEDGILTAKEIADVDLRGLDLVVLSACQTGLGDISQGEGVFGLQRGFKKAGARTILMSLWEVDDKATQILMTQFYKNLLAGQSKHQSLLSAQKYLREAENGKYNNPKYWASFILLDGLSGG